VYGEFVAFIDADDVWEPSKIEKQVSAFEDDVLMVYTSRVFIDSFGKEIIRKDSKKFSGYIVNKLLLSPFIPMSSVMMRSEVALSLKFNPSFNLVGDFDMWIRVSMLGFVKHIDEDLIYDRIHPCSTGKIENGKWLIERRAFYVDFLRKFSFKYFSIFIFILRTEFRGLLTRLRFFT